MTPPRLPRLPSDPERLPTPARPRKFNRAEVAEQQARAYELMLSGVTGCRAIGAELGISHDTVARRIKDACKLRPAPAVDEVRQMELDRCDRYLVHLDRQIQQGKSVARNVEVAMKVSERRAKLLGLDAPEQLEATVTQVTQEDIALAELVREAQAAAAVTEQQLREGLTANS